MLTRRELVRMGVFGAGGFYALERGGGVARVSSFFDTNGQSSPRLTPFVDPLPSFDVLPTVPQFSTIEPYARPFFGADNPVTGEKGTLCFEIAAVERNVRFHRDLPLTSAWTYVDRNNPPAANDYRLITFQYPPIRHGQATLKGILARHWNLLPTSPRDFGVPITTVHFHGIHAPSAADGFASDIVNRRDPFPAHVVTRPGEHFDYAYPFRDVGFSHGRTSNQDEHTSLIWFHDHLLDFTGQNVYRGLANVVPVFDELDTGNEEDHASPALGLPSGAYDIPLVIQDKTFDASGALVFNDIQDGFLGDTMVINGVVQPFHDVKRRKYRFRFLNGSNARIYEIFLTNDQGQTFPMAEIATDGGLLAFPIKNVQHFTLTKAKRIEVVVDFADPIFSGRSGLYFEDRMQQTNGRKPDGIGGSGTKLLKFNLGARVTDNSRVPDVLRPFAKVSAQDIARAVHRTFKFDRSHGVFTVNGQPVDIERPLATPKINTPEIWHYEGSGGWWHPVHTHLELGRVLRRNGKTPLLDEQDGVGRVDTVLLRGSESVDIFFNFRDSPGPFVTHCHNIEHEDMAMMFRWDVVE